MRESEHRKQLLIQQIADHRERMRLEVEVLQDANPVKPVIESGRRLAGILGAMRPGQGGGASEGTPGASSRLQLDADLVRTTLPVVLMVMRAVLKRRDAKRAQKERA